MTTLLTICLSVTFAAADEPPARELRYSGTVEQLDRQGQATPTKQFELYCLMRSDSPQPRLVFLIDDRGAGGWHWPERFGTQALDGSASPIGKRPIQLLHDHDGTSYPVPLVSPVFAEASKLTAGASWEANTHTYEVLRESERAGRPCWQVAIDNRIGRWATLWIDKQSGIIVAAEQRVFMGRGDQFRLTMELKSEEPIDSKRLQALTPVIDTLTSLRSDLERSEDETDPELSSEQLQKVREVVERLSSEAESTPFDRLAAVMARDVASQQQRTEGIADLAKKYVGKAAPEWTLTALDGKPIDPAANSGKIVVLPFWKYHGETLSEPYGQVGYLDFLRGRREKLGVKVYGVAVDPRLANDATRGAAVRDIHKLQEFFNLAYPLTTDDGSLLKKFGDPQRVGGSLPLWIVIGPDGKIAHYAVGNYDVKPEQGLRELDEVLVALIRQRDTTSEKP